MKQVSREFEIKEPSVNDINHGAATVPYNEKAKCWAKIGGDKLFNRKHAEQYAAKLNEIMRGAL